jgi:hypothetical protein
MNRLYVHTLVASLLLVFTVSAFAAPASEPVVEEPVSEAVLDLEPAEQEPPKSIETQVKGAPQKNHWHHWVGGVLDAAGVGFVIAGLYQNSVVADEYSAYSAAKIQTTIDAHRKNCDNAKSKRNAFYGAGFALLAGGLTFHFAF